MRFALIGTGFVADYYMTTLTNYPSLELAGVFDVNSARLTQFSRFYDVPTYHDWQSVLDDRSINLVVVLTTPETHFALCKAALEAGKHVYCEKPLAMDYADARALVTLATGKGLMIAGAPANAMSDAFALVDDALRANMIGTPKLVYAEMEDGPVFRENWQSWRSKSGAPWPGKHEFEIGCTLEHSGYGLTWLVSLFGPIKQMTGMSGTFFMDKGVEIAEDKMAPDWSCATLEFEDGVMARITNGLCAPRDRSLTIMGQDGTLTVDDLWDNRAHIYHAHKDQKKPLGFRMMRRLEARLGRVLPFQLHAGIALQYAGKADRVLPNYPSQIDFARGIDGLRKAIEAGDEAMGDVLAAKTLHITEAALALNRLADHNGRYTMKSTCARGH